MSYVFSRDNAEIEGRLSMVDLERVTVISEYVDRLSARGSHADLCGIGCDDESCTTRVSCVLREAGSEETIAWLAARGYLDLDEVMEGI